MHISAPSAHKAFARAMLQAAIGAVLVFSVADQSPMYFVLSTLGVSIVWLFSVRPRRAAPRLMINSVLLVVVIIAGVEMLRTGVGVSAFAVFAVLLMGVKMLDLREPRDDGQVLVLSVAILIAAVLTSNSLMTGVLMVIEIVLILRAVVLFQIHTVLSKAAPTSMTIEKQARVDIRSMVIATGFLCALFGSVIFVVLPRNIGMQAFGQWGGNGSISGFADTVELGRPGFISQSSEPVLDITVTDRDGRNIGKENAPAIYLRGAVLTDYHSGRWIKSPAMSVPLTSRAKLINANSTLKSKSDAGSSDWDRQYSITMRTSNDGETYLFSPWKTVEFRVGDEPMRLGLDFRRGIFLKDGMGGRLDYSVRSINTSFDDIQFDAINLRESVSEGQDEVLIESAIAMLARDIVRDAGIEPDQNLRPIEDDQAAIRAIETHLRTQFSYTLDAQAVPRGQDATAWFLFDRQTGHCEYFASSLTLMTRSIGIPARVITGYIASDFNTVTGQYVVRESNAHAWVEAQVSPGQWRTFDGTPPADFHALHEPDPSIWRSLAKMYESVEFLWVRTVVGYDSNTRKNIMGGSSTDFGLSSLGESLLNRLAAGRGRLVANAGVFAGVVFASSMLIGIIILKFNSIITVLAEGAQAWLMHLRDRLLKRESTITDPRYARLDKLVHRCLNRLDIPKPYWKPLKSHLQDQRSVLEAITATTRDAMLEASDLLYHHKFASNPTPIDPEHFALLETKLRKSEKSSAN